ncbi:MAG: hypothetical protein ACLTGI_08150 [Hoylesella buccalis]
MYGYFSANDDKEDETQIDGVDDGAYLHLGYSSLKTFMRTM